MKICFPARKANGEQYATLDDMMQPLCQEPHGSWLAGTNNMWHGGIHITRKSAPGSVLTKETAETAVPLQFMAGGEVVAWRINQDYLTGKYINNPLQYSGTFVLVKSTCTPDPEKKDNSLDFYSLYIGLAPLSAFPEHKLYQVTDKGDGLSQREYTGKEKDGDKAPVAKDKLKTGDSIIVLREITFDLKGQTQTFGLARMLNSKSEMTGGAFWVSLDPQYMAPAGKQRAHLPAWMQQAVAQGTFDTVVKPATRMEVAAGDAVGYLAEDIAPCDLHGVEKSAFAHIEVISTDSRMVDFLRNKAQVKSGPKFVHIHPESSVYARSGDTFTKTEGKVKKDIHKIMPQDKCHPFTDSSGKRWFDIRDGTWVSEDDVDADIGQYDLDKLGFKAFEEPSTSDMTKSLREGWIKDGFTRMAEWVRPERGIREKQVSDYYKALLRKMDSDNSGDLSGEELRHAVHFPEMDVRDIAARMLVRHDSEWFGGSNHHSWKTFLKQMDPLCVSYVKQWFDDMEWMSHVDGFSSGEPVWHMHPIVFLDALKTEDECAKLIWGEVVNQRLGQAKACLFRKKVIKICGEMWGEAEKIKYADVLMGCMSVETNRMFSSSVIAYRKARHKNGEIIFVSGKSGPRPKIELHAFTKEEIIKDTSLVEKNAVGLIQFTSMAVNQINIANNTSLTKLQLALMDEIEQLDYVKLYFTSNKNKFEQIKNPEDVYTYIFCPEGVGKPDDAVLYSKVDNERAYRMNASLDSTEHGNKGNNDGLIQKRELLARLNSLISEGEAYRNQCDCMGQKSDGPDWMPVALLEFNQYKNLIETDPELNNKIKVYHNTTNARGSDGTISWCSSFVNWCLMQTKYAPLATHSALAYSWGQRSWHNGDVVDKPFYGAIAVMNYSHVGFVCGINPDGRLLILGGNQGGGRIGTANCISIRANSASSIKYLMKPKGYNVRPEDYVLKVINVSGPDSSYSDTH